MEQANDETRRRVDLAAESVTPVTKLDPDVQRLLDAARALAKPPLHELTVEQARAGYELACRENGLIPESCASVRDVEAKIEARIGAPVEARTGTKTGVKAGAKTGAANEGPQEALKEVPLDQRVLRMRVYCPANASSENGPALVFFHGGGWVVGSLDSHDPICRRLANVSGCKVVAVDYRLAPENLRPAAAIDAMAAYDWIQRNAGLLGIDPQRVGVVGDSAGGLLAAIVAIGEHADDIARPKVQLLFYPVTDLIDESPGYARVTSGLPFTAATMRWFKDHYLGPVGSTGLAPNPASGSASDALFDDVPLRHDGIHLAPATLLVTCGHDPLCEEGEAYAKALKAAGVRIQHRHLSELNHGFLTNGGRIRATLPVLDRAAAFARDELS